MVKGIFTMLIVVAESTHPKGHQKNECIQSPVIESSDEQVSLLLLP